MKKSKNGERQVTPGFLRKRDAAGYLSISVRTLTDWQRRRLLRFAKISHRVCLFKISDLDEAIKRFTARAVGERE